MIKEDYSYNVLHSKEAQPGQDIQQALSQAVSIALEGEHDATRIYDNIIALAGSSSDATLQNIVRKVVYDIRAEEQLHIGQLYELLKIINAAAATNIIQGEQETQEQVKPFIDEIQ